MAQLDEENKLQVVFANDKGVQHRDSIFVTAAPDSGEQWGFGFRWLLSGCLPDGKALKLFFETAAKDEKILEAFTGMKMRITLGLPPKGIRAHVLADGTFIGIDPSVIDPETNQPVVQTAVHAKLEDLWTEVKATNKK
ncbi:hypothetical protein ACSFB2_12895, partial [Glaesserella parasuis]|uniref:hypothetical protein n=1 Tax=Glaesserella parasuis TaxID=738 RepID=UPI003F2F9CFA